MFTGRCTLESFLSVIFSCLMKKNSTKFKEISKENKKPQQHKQISSPSAHYSNALTNHAVLAGLNHTHPIPFLPRSQENEKKKQQSLVTGLFLLEDIKDNNSNESEMMSLWWVNKRKTENETTVVVEATMNPTKKNWRSKGRGSGMLRCDGVKWLEGFSVC